MKQKAFSLVELIVVITILAIIVLNLILLNKDISICNNNYKKNIPLKLWKDDICYNTYIKKINWEDQFINNIDKELEQRGLLKNINLQANKKNDANKKILESCKLPFEDGIKLQDENDECFNSYVELIKIQVNKKNKLELLKEHNLIIN